jgi:hypothetical protein
MADLDKQLVQKWLRNQLVQLVNVQRTTFGQGAVSNNPEADLIVHTWAGVLIYVHLVDEPMKPGRIRRILENATSNGIVTLFILDADLLPRQGERVDSHKWFTAFQHLANDRVYTYHNGKNGVLIRPLQFTIVGRDEVESQYGAQIPVTQLRYLRHTVKQGAFKGYWLIADFETELSAQNPVYRSVGGAHRAAGANGTFVRSPEGASSRLDHAYHLLGVARNATRDDVKAAFRKLAFEVHPDVSQLPKDEAEARFKVLSEAYEFIKVTNAWS